jgi:hypothetical protein
MSNYFTELYKIDCSNKIEKKNGLNYISWAFAWAELKKQYPDSFYTIYENKDGLFYHTDGKTVWVKTGVTIPIMMKDELGCDDKLKYLEHIEYLPVMDLYNKSISLENITSTAVNKSIQRSLTKAVARHGLGLHIYEGEDMPRVINNEGDEKDTISKKSELIDELILMGVEIEKVCKHYNKPTLIDFTIKELKDAIIKKQADLSSKKHEK